MSNWYSFQVTAYALIFFSINLVNAEEQEERVGLQCSNFEVSSNSGHEVKYSSSFDATAFSNELLIAKNLVGIGAKVSINNCSFTNTNDNTDETVPVFLSAKASALAGFVIVLDQSRSPSTKTFSAKNLPEATTTSTWGTLFELANPQGERLTAGLYFRKRIQKVWEYYAVFPAEVFANTTEEAGKSIIVEVGTLSFNEEGKLESLERWLGQEDSNARFFRRFLPADFQDLKAGELSLNPDGPPHFLWKEGPELDHFEIDLGQNSNSTATIYLEAQKMKLLGFAHDGRLTFQP